MAALRVFCDAIEGPLSLTIVLFLTSVTSMKMSLLVFFLSSFLAQFSALADETHLKINRIRVLSINSAITPATLEYLQEGVKNLPAESVIVLRINTPGGLVSTTKEIITLLNREEKPLIAWITPAGASASSAGAIIASSAHYIIMSPGTNMGAATPVGLGEDLKESDGKKKAVSDLSAMVRSLNDMRSRPSGPFVKMITEAESYTDQEAFKLKMIDGVSNDLSEIMKIVSTKEITLRGKKAKLLIPETLIPEEKLPTAVQRMLEVLTNPTTAYVLFLVGLALIYFEFQSPGGFVAGAIGATLLIIAAIAFQVLPLHWGSVGLIILGAILLFLEIFVPSFGLLSIAGTVSFVLGSLFLFKGTEGFITIDYSVILSTLGGVFFALGVLVWYLYQDKKKNNLHDDFFTPNHGKGIVMSKGPEYYQVKVKGEIWNSVATEKLTIGETVEVIHVSKENLVITVKKSPTL